MVARNPMVAISWLVLALAATPARAEQEVPPATSPAPEIAPERIAQRIDAYVRPYVDAGHLSGYLLVARGEQVIYERAFGMANYELGVPVGPETKLNVASVTKPMTLIALIRLVEQEKLSLADPLSKWIPDFPSGDKITVEMLASHRAGIPHRVTEPHEETVPRTAAQVVELVKSKPLMFEPGERSNYSSAGFSVLARVLELASGESYGELLRELVFEPAGLENSAHTNARALLPNRASSYLLSSGGWVNAKLQDLSFLVGAGSVYSTARDLHALLSAVRDGRLGEAVAANWAERDSIEWNGLTNGFRAFADWSRETDVTVVFTGNKQTGAADRIRRAVPRIAAGEEVPPQPLPAIEPVSVSEAELRRYEAVYELRPGSPLRARVEDGALMVNAWLLVPTGERTFFSPQDYAEVEVFLDDDGRPLRLDWTVNGQTYPCPRVED